MKKNEQEEEESNKKKAGKIGKSKRHSPKI